MMNVGCIYPIDGDWMTTFAHNTAFNSSINCTPFEAGHGLRARTITEARANPRLQITAEGGMDIDDADKNWEKSIFPKVCKLAERLASSQRGATPIAMAQADERPSPQPSWREDASPSANRRSRLLLQSTDLLHNRRSSRGAGKPNTSPTTTAQLPY